MPGVRFWRSYASTSCGCTVSSRMRHGRSLWPSMTGLREDPERPFHVRVGLLSRSRLSDG